MPTMPYNTRRKSVSLSLLGIHIPQSHSSRSSSHRSPPATTTAQTSTTDDQPPTKKIKRSDSSNSSSLSPSSPPKFIVPKIKNELHSSSGGRIAETTPPPSPGDSTGFKIDTQGVNDEIVVGVIEQLERTGNRPHLLKELAAVLQHTIPIVQTSANQPAIISSRLTNYMKRTWTALAPCPLGKELIGTHPKRIYFFLANQPRQPFPEPPETANQPRIISPSLTSKEDDEDQCDRRRSEMSPSPEVDLSSPDFEDENDPMSASDSFSNLHLHHHSAHTSQSSLSQGRTSPPLEGDEREFTQTASSLQQRQHSQPEEKSPDAPHTVDATMEELIYFEDHEEATAKRSRADADALFGPFDTHLATTTSFFPASSPMMRPVEKAHDVSLKYEMPSTTDTSFAWTELKRSETVELDELDDLFESY